MDRARHAVAAWAGGRLGRDGPAVRGMAVVLRTPRRRCSRGPRLRGPPLGRQRDARLHRLPARMESVAADLHPDPGAAGAARKATDWGAGKRQFTSVYLEPLPEPAIRELLTGLVPGLPDQAARAIAARADGVPLYAVETVRMLVAEGRLIETDGVYAPSGDLSTLAVPESLTALIASRLDALEPDARPWLRTPPSSGQRFTVAGLAAVSGLDPETLDPRLEMLVRRELLAWRPIRVRPSGTSTGSSSR